MESEKDKPRDPSTETGLNVEKLGFFNNNAYFVFLYRKCQSLSTALYMVTEHFPEQEPLKWRIRDKAAAMIEDSISLPNIHSSDRKNVINNIFESSLEILSFVDIASTSHLISSTNAKIIRKELENMLSLMEGREESLKIPTNFVLDNEMFKLDAPTHSWNLPTESKGQEDVKDKKNLSVTPKRQNTPTSLKDRESLILELLKKNNNLSIKDIGQAFSDCSEKTIQRELSKMVERGLLKKGGERRWSKYSII